ncbi:MAG: CDP-alcohol phosphatidyltransferase family protein [Candidatus Altiarchaeota archaeon]
MSNISRHIPNSLTLINIGFGIAAILLALSGQYGKSAGMIMVSVIVDCFDGYMARLLKSTTRIGSYMDLISDFISFGVAAAVLTVKLFDVNVYIALFFIAASGYRLIYFMKTKNDRFFYGMPTTVAGGFIASISLLKPEIPVSHNLLMVILSLLMLAFRIKYYRLNFKGRRTISTLIAIVLGVFVLDFTYGLMLIMFLIITYMAFGWLHVKEPK